MVGICWQAVLIIIIIIIMLSPWLYNQESHCLEGFIPAISQYISVVERSLPTMMMMMMVLGMMMVMFAIMIMVTPLIKGLCLSPKDLMIRISVWCSL